MRLEQRTFNDRVFKKKRIETLNDSCVFFVLSSSSRQILLFQIGSLSFLCIFIKKRTRRNDDEEEYHQYHHHQDFEDDEVDDGGR